MCPCVGCWGPSLSSFTDDKSSSLKNSPPVRAVAGILAAAAETLCRSRFFHATFHGVRVKRFDTNMAQQYRPSFFYSSSIEVGNVLFLFPLCIAFCYRLVFPPFLLFSWRKKKHSSFISSFKSAIFIEHRIPYLILEIETNLQFMDERRLRSCVRLFRCKRGNHRIYRTISIAFCCDVAFGLVADNRFGAYTISPRHAESPTRKKNFLKRSFW